MNIDDIQKMIDEVRKQKGDSEIAHSLEDGAYISVLEAIRDETTDPHARELASKVLEINSIEFSRWYA